MRGSEKGMLLQGSALRGYSTQISEEKYGSEWSDKLNSFVKKLGEYGSPGIAKTTLLALYSSPYASFLYSSAVNLRNQTNSPPHSFQY